MIPMPPPAKGQSPLQRLEALIVRIDTATASVLAGKRVDAKALDDESRVLHAELKKKPDTAARPLLLKSVTAIERLIEALEKQTAKKH